MERFLQLPIIRSFHNLSYRIKVALGLLLLVAAAGIGISLMLNSQQKLITLIEEQNKTNLLEKNLRDFSKHVIKHHVLLKRYQNGEDNLKGELLQQQTAIVTDLQSLQQRVKSLQDNPEERASENLLVKDVITTWQQIIRNPLDVKRAPSDELYNTILQRINTWMILIGDGAAILTQDPLFGHYFIETELTGLPQASLLIDSYLNNISPGDKGRVSVAPLESSVQNNAASVQKGIRSYQQDAQNFTVEVIPLQESLNAYNESSDDFFNYHRLKGTDSWNPLEALAKTDKLVSNQYALWDNLAVINDSILNQKLDHLRWQRMIALPLIALCILSGLFFLFIVALEFYIPLKNMMEAVDKFAKGDMSSRTKIYYDDDVGRVGKILNQLGDSFEHIVEQLHRTGIQLTTSTTEIAAAAKQQEITVVEQEATTKEIAVTAGEISATAKEFAKTMNSISLTAEQTSGLATTGKEGLTQMESIMRQMVEASANIASRLGVLNEKAGAITSVITTIAKVADQTNLLSLNASIEAEKAGEMGRSFAVIAREIRRLADQTANATVDIEKMVNEMVSAVSGAVMGVDKFTEEIRTGVSQVSRIGEVLSQIIEQVQGLTVSFENVNQGMRNQTLGAEQINEAINQLSDVAQQTSASIRQFHNAIEQLNIAAREMQSTASKIKHI